MTIPVDKLTNLVNLTPALTTINKQTSSKKINITHIHRPGCGLAKRQFQYSAREHFQGVSHRHGAQLLNGHDRILFSFRRRRLFKYGQRPLHRPYCLVQNKWLKASSNAFVGETLYHVRWKGFLTSNNTWEPIAKLRCLHVFACHKKNKIGPGPHINESVDCGISQINGNAGPDKTETIPSFVDDVADLRLNWDRRLYRVKLYRSPDDEEYTWKPTKNLSRSKILSYYNSRKLDVPSDIDLAIDG